MGFKNQFDFSTDCHYETTHRTILKFFRFINVLLHSFFFLFLVLFVGPIFFKFISYWTVFLTFFYFLFISLSYQTKVLRKFCYLLFEGIFPIAWVVTILWFGTFANERNYALMVVVHIFPTLTLVVELILSRIVFYRKHYWMPFGLILLYLLCVLIPFTIEQGAVYPGVNLVNWFTYVVFISLVLIILLSFEVARLIRTKTCKSEPLNKNNTENQVGYES